MKKAVWRLAERTIEERRSGTVVGCLQRVFRRYIDRYEEEGLDGLIDKRLNQVAHRRAPVDKVMRLVDRYRRSHEGWNARHF